MLIKRLPFFAPEGVGTETAPTNDGSLDSAADALSKAREEHAATPKEAHHEPDGAAKEATDGSDTESPPDQTETGEAVDVQANSDDAAPANVEAPAWFTPEEKALFESLPPEQRQPMLRLAKGAQQALSRRDQEYRTAIAQAQQAAQIADQHRQYLAQQLQNYAEPLAAQFRREFADVISGEMDPIRLAREDPQRFAEYSAYQKEFEGIAFQRQQLTVQAQQAEAAKLQAHAERRVEAMQAWRPELRDQAKFDQFASELENYARQQGYPDEVILKASIEDVKTLHKAMMWDRAQAAKAKAPTAPVQQLRPGQQAVQGYVRQQPRVMKPGSGNANGAAEDRIAAIDKRARESGSLDDAAARIRARLAQGSRARA